MSGHCSTCVRFRRFSGHLREWGACKKLPFQTPTKETWTFCKEHEMPKPPTKAKRGIPIGSYDTIADAAGKVKLKPKRKAMGAATEIAKRKRKKWRTAK